MSINGDKNHEIDVAVDEAAFLKSIKTVSIDGEVISTHDLKSLRDDQEAEERKEAFQTGRLQRMTRINMSGGFI